MIDKELNMYHGFLFEDPKATENLIAKFSDRFIRLAYLYTKDSAEAENLVENAFATAFVKQKVFEQGDDFKLYLYKLVRDKCLHYLFWHKNSDAPEDIEELFNTPSFQQIIQQNEHFRDLYAAMAMLPPKYADLLYLAYFNNLPIEDICKITKQSKNKVYHRLERAKPVLKKAIAREKRLQMMYAEEELAREREAAQAEAAQAQTAQAEPETAQAEATQVEAPQTEAPAQAVDTLSAEASIEQPAPIEATEEQAAPIVQGAQES